MAVGECHTVPGVGIGPRRSGLQTQGLQEELWCWGPPGQALPLQSPGADAALQFAPHKTAGASGSGFEARCSLAWKWLHAVHVIVTDNKLDKITLVRFGVSGGTGGSCLGLFWFCCFGLGRFGVFCWVCFGLFLIRLLFQNQAVMVARAVPCWKSFWIVVACSLCISLRFTRKELQDSSKQGSDLSFFLSF